MKAVSRTLSVTILCLFTLFGYTLFAQQTQASLSGQVLDPQGATINDATVTVTNVDTTIARVTKSDSAGRYTIGNLNPGKYAISVQATGFSEKKETGIILAVGQNQSLDVPLALGGANDVIEVTASAPVTDTETSSQGTVIDNQKVVGLPLNQRTFYGLALLSPAAYMPGQASTLGFRGGFNVAGNNETANTFTINGIDDNDQNVMVPSFRPSVEGIQEFKLLTGVYSAEYGRTSGGQVVVITKTGGNQFHGDIFEFIRNSQFDAKNYFTLAGTPTTFRRNQFGGTIGGPIIKDRTFFFLSYEGLRLAQPTVATTNIPNPAFLTGNFSSICTVADGGFVAGICKNAAHQLSQPGSGLTQAAQTPYLNNQIPVGNFDPIGLAILKLYPTPNAGYDTSAASVPYTLNQERVENMDEGSARVDHKFSDKDSILAQYNYFNDPSFEPSLSLCSSAVIPGSGCTQNQISTLIGLNETHIFSAHWLNEARIGFDRLEQPRIGQDDGNTAFPKVPGAFSDPTIPANLLGGAPATSVTGYASVHPYTNLPQHRWDDHFNFVDNVSWSHGAHNFKFGVNLLQARYTDLYVANATGTFSFTGIKSATLNNLTTGNSAADLALGYAASATRTPTAPNFHVRYNSIGVYAQDDWKVTSHLTLNLGIRYEDFLPVTDTRNILSNWVYPTAANPNGTIQVAGQGGSGQTVYNNDANNFAPRVGLAYEPFGDPRTVIHASYGMFYNSPSIGNGAILSMGINVPFRLTQTFNSTATAQSRLSTNAFPVVVGTTPDGSPAHPYTNVAPTGIDPNFRTLYMNEFGADVQQQLTPTIALTIGYIGNEGARIPRPIAANQYVNGVKPIGGVAANIPNPLGIGTTYTGPLNLQWGNITEYISAGHSTFHAMTVKGQKNMANGVSFILAYTFAKAMDNASGYASTSQASSGTPQDSRNLQAERGLSDFNVSSRIALSPVIELPFGRNKAYLTHGIGAAVAGGWQLSGIYQFDTGRPFTIGMTTNNSNSIYGSDRPNLIGDPNSGPKTVNQWFNTAGGTQVVSPTVTSPVWQANAPNQFGNERRNAVIGPDYSDLDVAVQRAFAFGERYAVAVRAESFNAFNKANFLNPLGLSTGAFGTANFGKLTAANDPRSMQFSAKLTF